MCTHTQIEEGRDGDDDEDDGDAGGDDDDDDEEGGTLKMVLTHIHIKEGDI